MLVWRAFLLLWITHGAFPLLPTHHARGLPQATFVPGTPGTLPHCHYHAYNGTGKEVGEASLLLPHPLLTPSDVGHRQDYGARTRHFTFK